DAWLDDAHQEIEAVDILAAEERALLFGSGQALAGDQRNETLRDTQTLVGRFQQQVDRLPNQTAVVLGKQILTYAELNAQANQLAHYLGKQGIQKGVTVGLFMERSVSMIVSILAILKAGAAYLPIDPAYPVERTHFMVEDSNVAILLTQQALMATCPVGQLKDRIICLDTHGDAIAQEPTGAPAVELTAQDLAYILFTSGSTGQPKGVMVEHRNVLAMVNGFEQTAPAGEQLRGTALCSYGFDVSVWEIFSNLCFGGTVYLVPPETVASHNQFAQYLITHDITSAYIPPALLSMVVQELERSDHRIVLNRILVGVEPIQQKLLQRYRQRIPQLRIVNGYGPTETTVCATFYSFDTVTDPQGIVPIGKAVPGYEVYVVNDQGQQVPMGIKGEIVIGGAGLSRGYLNRPELMAERFIENPFGAGKLYKTGDQARYLPDGNLEFLGRLDHQVKIRGFRVELREVEAALNQHPSIQQGVVIAEKTNQGRQSLLAYVVTSESSLTHGEIRDALQQTLPDYMVPTAFILLDYLPLTPNGKVDRPLLLSPDYTQRQRLGTDR
ncbi:MAG: amino acid adenylation domain-containing protein, partial [Cyanobacteria bacterium J06607_17]